MVSPLTLRFRRDRRQVSVFSAASGLKSAQFDQKTDSSVVESDTSVAAGLNSGQSNRKRNFMKSDAIFKKNFTAEHAEIAEII